MKKKFMIVDFEGLDCSFKETNAKILTERIGDEAKYYSFPSYDSESSYFVRQYLGGAYKDVGLNNEMVIRFFILDMFDQWNTQVIPDIKNGIKYVILDRFWTSNLYYFSNLSCDGTALNRLDYDYTVRLAQKYHLPTPDIIFKMKTDLELMLRNVRYKAAKNDIHESNTDFLIKVFKQFDVCYFYNLGAGVFPIEVYKVDMDSDDSIGRSDMLEISKMDSENNLTKRTVKVVTSFKSKTEIANEVFDKFTLVDKQFNG